MTVLKFHHATVLEFQCDGSRHPPANRRFFPQVQTSEPGESVNEVQLIT